MRWLIILLALAGCEQSYRYPCQNPDNWMNKECQKPVCEVNQTCADHIFADQKRMEPWINGGKVTTESKEDKGGRNDCAK
jgi:hypothetical protein